MLRCQNLSRKEKSERTKEVNSYRNVLIVCVVIHHYLEKLYFLAVLSSTSLREEVLLHEG